MCQNGLALVWNDRNGNSFFFCERKKNDILRTQKCALLTARLSMAAMILAETWISHPIFVCLSPATSMPLTLLILLKDANVHACRRHMLIMHIFPKTHQQPPNNDNEFNYHLLSYFEEAETCCKIELVCKNILYNLVNWKRLLHKGAVTSFQFTVYNYWWKFPCIYN